MKYQPQPDRAIFVADPSEENARKDCRKRLRHRLLEVDHGVRYRHRKDRISSERWFQAVNQKSAKEKLQPEKLNEIDEFPYQQR